MLCILIPGEYAYFLYLIIYKILDVIIIQTHLCVLVYLLIAILSLRCFSWLNIYRHIDRARSFNNACSLQPVSQGDFFGDSGPCSFVYYSVGMVLLFHATAATSLACKKTT